MTIPVGTAGKTVSLPFNLYPKSCTFQPFPAHILGLEGRNEKIWKAKIIYLMWPMQGSTGDSFRIIREASNASSRILYHSVTKTPF